MFLVDAGLTQSVTKPTHKKGECVKLTLKDSFLVREDPEMCSIIVAMEKAKQEATAVTETVAAADTTSPTASASAPGAMANTAFSRMMAAFDMRRKI